MAAQSATALAARVPGDAYISEQSQFFQGKVPAQVITDLIASVPNTAASTAASILKTSAAGSILSENVATGTITCSGATSTASNVIPAGAIVLGTVIRVTTLITGCTSIKIGDGSDDDRWGASIALTAGTTTSAANFTAATFAPTTATASVVLTAVGGGASFSAGVVRYDVHYLTLTGPTS
jgi:hypothetical protein